MGGYSKLSLRLHLLQSVYLFETHMAFMFLCTKGSVQQLGLWKWVNVISYKKENAELVVETYFRLKEKEWPLKCHSEGHGGGKQKAAFCMQESLILFSFISMNNTSFKLFYLLSALWKTRHRKEIQASRQNIILIAQIWLKAEKLKDSKNRENHKD